MSADLEHIRQIMREADCLYTEAQVEEAIAKVGAHITREMADTNPVVFCVMNGGLIFAGKLLTHLQFPLEASYLHATRYRNETTGGDLVWKHKPATSLFGRRVLLVDDILDEGYTLQGVRTWCLEQGATDVRIAAMTVKKHDRALPDVTADYAGIELPDRYVFGFGMDVNETLRCVPAIYAMKE